MLLVEVWNNNIRTGAPDYRLSQQYLPLTYQWDAKIIDIQGMSLAVDKFHGGMLKSNYGSMTLIPDASTPVMTDYIGVDISFTNTTDTGAAKKLLFSGVAYVKRRTRTEISYDLFTWAPTVTIDTKLDFTSGSDTLVSIFQDYCTSASWTLNSTLASATNIAVNFVAETGQLYADMLSSLAATYGHYFLVDPSSTTIHLRKISEGASTAGAVPIDGFEYFPSSYDYKIPPSKVSVGDSVVYGPPYYFGPVVSEEAFSDDDTLNENLANRLLAVYTESPFDFTLYMPLEYFVDKGLNFVTENVITWTEDSVVFPYTSTFVMVIQSISFDIANARAILKGYTTRN